MLELYANSMIKGFTTNPALMRQAGMSYYEAFAKNIMASISDRAISCEVFSNDFADMGRRELRAFSVWAESNSPQEDSQKGGVERVFGV
jgi:transaldolase